MECRHQQCKWYGLAIWLRYPSVELEHLFLNFGDYYLSPWLLVNGEGGICCLGEVFIYIYNFKRARYFILYCVN